MHVKNLQTGRHLVIDCDDSGALGFLQAKRFCPKLRVEARTPDLKRLFLVALCDLELVIPATVSVAAS